ncbi:MAG: InlB B-repeat-containing protein [Bacillota bacterium]
MACKKIAIILILIISIAVVFTACSVDDESIAVNFMVGDELYVSLEVSGDSAVELPNDPTLEGYGFMGWYLDAQYEEVFDANAIIAETTTLYAKFASDVQYSVKFVDSDGSTLRSAMVSCWVVPTVPTVSDKVSAEITYKFIGWDSEVVAATADVVYTAQYEKITNTYTLTLDAMGGECDTTTITVEYGTIVALDAVATQEGYNFYGWTLNDEVVAEVTITKDTTVYATWKAIYTVWFMGYDNALVSREILEEGDMPTVPTVDNVKLFEYTYTFIGWDKVISSVTADTTYTAKFLKELNEYTLTYDIADGTFTDGTALEEAYDYGTEVILSTYLEREGYLFIGWVWGSETVESVTITSDITVEAVWIKQYTIVFSYMDAEYFKDVEVVYTIAENTMPEAPTVADSKNTYAIYTFSYWAVDGVQCAVSVATADVTYTAVYDADPLTYTITFDANGGFFNDNATTIEIEENYNSTIYLADYNNVSRDGYILKGWATTETSTETVSNAIEITETITFYAIWEDTSTIQYTIYFLDDVSGAELSSVIVNYGEMPTPPDMEEFIVRDGTKYKFVGWSPEIEVATYITSYTAVYEEVQQSID